jgi:hypothetical protein
MPVKRITSDGVPTIAYNSYSQDFRTRLIISTRGLLGILNDPNSLSPEVISQFEEVKANFDDLVSYLESKSSSFWKQAN